MLRPFSVLSRSSNSDWIIEEKDEWKNDEKVCILIQRLQQDSSASNTFTRKNDSLWYKDIAYIYVITPNSNKRYYWNCTPLQLEGTRDF
jgi:hypothetical protein